MSGFHSLPVPLYAVACEMVRDEVLVATAVFKGKSRVIKGKGRLLACEWRFLFFFLSLVVA